MTVTESLNLLHIYWKRLHVYTHHGGRWHAVIQNKLYSYDKKGLKGKLLAKHQNALSSYICVKNVLTTGNNFPEHGIAAMAELLKSDLNASRNIMKKAILEALLNEIESIKLYTRSLSFGLMITSKGEC